MLMIYVILVAFGFANRKPSSASSSSSWDSLPKNVLTLYFALLVANMAYSTPETHMSTGVHQTVGPCNVRDTDLAGQERQVKITGQAQKFSTVRKFLVENKGTFKPRLRSF